MPPQQVMDLSLLLKAGSALDTDLVHKGFLQQGFESLQGESPQLLLEAFSRVWLSSGWFFLIIIIILKVVLKCTCFCLRPSAQTRKALEEIKQLFINVIQTQFMKPKAFPKLLADIPNSLHWIDKAFQSSSIKPVRQRTWRSSTPLLYRNAHPATAVVLNNRGKAFLLTIWLQSSNAVLLQSQQFETQHQQIRKKQLMVLFFVFLCIKWKYPKSFGT